MEGEPQEGAVGGADSDGGDAEAGAVQEPWSQDPVLRVSQPTCLLLLAFFF